MPKKAVQHHPKEHHLAQGAKEFPGSFNVVSRVFAGVQTNMKAVLIYLLIAGVATWLGKRTSLQLSTTYYMSGQRITLIDWPSLVVAIAFTIGLPTLGLYIADNRKIPFEKLLVFDKRFLPLIAASILSTISIVLGVILLVIPGIILALSWAFTSFVIVEGTLGPVAAMKKSYELIKGQRLRLLVLLITALTSLIPVVILAIVFPVLRLFLAGVVDVVSLGAAAYLYRHIQDVKGVKPANHHQQT